MGKVKTGEAKVTGVLGAKDDNAATMTMMTDSEEAFSDSDTGSDNREDFYAEKAPCLPPEEILYGWRGSQTPRVGMTLKCAVWEVAGSCSVLTHGPKIMDGSFDLLIHRPKKTQREDGGQKPRHMGL